MNNIYDVAIIGGGPAGMMAGISGKTAENSVCVLEKKQHFGKKIAFDGKKQMQLYYF